MEKQNHLRLLFPSAVLGDQWSRFAWTDGFPGYEMFSAKTRALLGKLGDWTPSGWDFWVTWNRYFFFFLSWRSQIYKITMRLCPSLTRSCYPYSPDWVSAIPHSFEWWGKMPLQCHRVTPSGCYAVPLGMIYGMHIDYFSSCRVRHNSLKHNSITLRENA